MPIQRYAFVFAQPAVDRFGVKLLEKWYAAGCRLFMGWASIKNTAGKDREKDLAAQREWRAAVRKLGPDARYVDYPAPDWRWTPERADLIDMITDPQCLGFMAPDEFNRKKADNKTFVVTPEEWKAYWDAIEASPGAPAKIRVGDYSGSLLSAAWGDYTGADMAPFDARLTVGCTNWHPRNVYGSTRPDADAYPGRAVRMLAKIAPKKPRWYISECAFEKLNTTGGRAPLAMELDSQFARVMAEDSADAPIQGWGWFPQEPHPSAAHIFDATTPEQFEVVKRINAQFTGPLAPPPPVDPNAALIARIQSLEDGLDAAVLIAKVAKTQADVAAGLAAGNATAMTELRKKLAALGA